MELDEQKKIDSMIRSHHSSRRAKVAHRDMDPSPTPDEIPQPKFVSSHAKAEILRDVSKVKTQLLNPFGEPLTDADVQYVFEKCDVNQDKRISMKEFLTAMDHLHINISADRLKQFFNNLDTAHDRCLSLEEFRAGLEHVSSSEKEIWQKMLESDFVEDLENPPDIEKIKETLSKTNTDWRFRISAMHSFMKQCCKKQSRTKFDAKFRPCKEPLLLQLGDRRSAVVRECCIVIAKIALIQTSFLTRWVPRMIEVLFETLRIKVEIISVSAHQALRALVRCVPETKKLEITNALIKGAKEPYVIVRSHSFEYLHMILHHTREDGVKHSGGFWVKVMAILLKGLNDPATQVRHAARHATCELYLLNEAKTKKEILEKLRKQAVEEFFSMLQTYT